MTVGVVLTGGASTRMGVDKATMTVGGKPMVVRVADVLWEAGMRPVECQGGDVDAISQYGLFVAPDADPRRGPVAAIHTALARHHDQDVVVVACDLVAIDAATVRGLVDAGAAHSDADAVAVTADGRHHLASWWRRGVAGRLGELLTADVHAYHDAIARLSTVDLAVDSSLVRNVNSPADVAIGE